MKKLALACAALATIALAIPTVANAEEFSVRVGGDRGMYRDGGDYRTRREFRGARAEYGYDRHDRGAHRDHQEASPSLGRLKKWPLNRGHFCGGSSTPR